MTRKNLAPRLLPPKATVEDILSRYDPWHVPQVKHTPAARSEKQSSLPDKIHALLQRLEQPAQAKDIAALLDADAGHVARSLRRMVARGEISCRPAVEGRKKPLLYFVERMK